MLETVAGVWFGAVGGPAAEMPDLGGGLACLLGGVVRVRDMKARDVKVQDVRVRGWGRSVGGIGAEGGLRWGL